MNIRIWEVYGWLWAAVRPTNQISITVKKYEKCSIASFVTRGTSSLYWRLYVAANSNEFAIIYRIMNVSLDFTTDFRHSFNSKSYNTWRYCTSYGWYGNMPMILSMIDSIVLYISKCIFSVCRELLGRHWERLTTRLSTIPGWLTSRQAETYVAWNIEKGLQASRKVEDWWGSWNSLPGIDSDGVRVWLTVYASCRG